VKNAKYIPVWKKAPFLRLLAPFIAGILIQWHFPVSERMIRLFVPGLILLLVMLPFIFRKHYLLLPQITGAALMLLIFLFGCWRVHVKDARNNPHNITHYSDSGILVRAIISEPLIEKEKSYKCIAHILSVFYRETEVPATGRFFIYFKKDSLPPAIQPGDEIVISKPLQQIRNSGNPGGMDYRRYCLFQGITHQVFLQEKDIIVTGNTQPSWLNRLLWRVRNVTLNTIRRFIPGSREQGVAEALLIGYRNDMDRELTQAYSNTGTVHVIAISGMAIQVNITAQPPVYYAAP
jgi:competence protein ComEC